MSDDGTEALDALRERVRASEFQRWAGLELVSLSEGRTEFALRTVPEHRNLEGGLHGGVLSILADTATGIAMHSAIGPDRTHVTLQLDLHFIGRPSSDRILGAGRVLRSGRRIGFAEAELTDEEGTLVATARATFLLMDRRGG
jgi:uncharacterized protein (TIGR00369 family)